MPDPYVTTKDVGPRANVAAWMSRTVPSTEPISELRAMALSARRRAGQRSGECRSNVALSGPTCTAADTSEYCAGSVLGRSS
jgi:hypothetical protein